MTDPTPPLTPEELFRLRADHEYGNLTSRGDVARLLATLDAARAAATENPTEKGATPPDALLDPRPASDAALRARISLEAINGTRPVWIGEGVFEQYTARTAEGWLVTIEWGEPDADGFYSPTFTEHRPAAAPTLSDALREALAQIDGERIRAEAEMGGEPWERWRNQGVIAGLGFAASHVRAALEETP